MSALLVRLAYHESAHALVARSMERPLEYVAISAAGGVMKAREPLAGDRSPEELERALVIFFAGQAGETYAPSLPLTSAMADSNGSPDALVAGMAAMADEPDTPSDTEIIEGYRERLGDAVVERARRLAAHLVDRLYVTRRLQLVADRLLLAGVLTVDDLERLLDAEWERLRSAAA